MVKLAATLALLSVAGVEAFYGASQINRVETTGLNAVENQFLNEYKGYSTVHPQDHDEELSLRALNLGLDQDSESNSSWPFTALAASAALLTGAAAAVYKFTSKQSPYEEIKDTTDNRVEIPALDISKVKNLPDYAEMVIAIIDNKTRELVGMQFERSEKIPQMAMLAASGSSGKKKRRKKKVEEEEAGPGETEQMVPDMKKRNIMNAILAGSIGIAAAPLAFSYLSFFVPKTAGGGSGGQAALDSQGNPITLKSWMATHKPGDRELVQGLKGDATWVVTTDDGVQDFGINAVCTHLGCVVPWNKAENKFMCPCHGSQYDKNGRVVRGPAPLSLALAHLSINKDNEQIQFTPWTETDFRTGDAPWWKA